MKNRIIGVITALTVMLLSFASIYTESTDFEYQMYKTVDPVTKEEKVIDTRDMTYDELMSQMAADFFHVKEANEDTVGFLNIPNIGYYPVVMGEDNQFYLTHNEYKEDQKAGIPFMNTASGGTFDDIALIHGHKMKSGAMFGALHKYKDEEFFKNNDYISVFDGKYLYLYQPFSVMVYTDGEGLVTGEPMEGEARAAYMADLLTKSFVKPEGELDLTNPVLLLSTCDYTRTDGRLLVSAVMVKKVKYE